jgi:hypothetical protein
MARGFLITGAALTAVGLVSALFASFVTHLPDQGTTAFQTQQMGAARSTAPIFNWLAKAIGAVGVVLLVIGLIVAVA